MSIKRKDYKVSVSVSESEWIRFKVALLQQHTTATRVFSLYVKRYGLPKESAVLAAVDQPEGVKNGSVDKS